MNKPDIHDHLVYARTDGIWEDFNSYTSGGLWTTGGVSGTCAVGDGDGGLLTQTTGAVINQSAIVSTTNKLLTFKAGAPAIYQCEINYTEANTNNAMIAVGFSSSWAATLLANTTGTPASSFSGALIYKIPGETVWRAIASIGTTQVTATSINSCLQPGLNQRLIIQCMIVQTILEVSFWQGTAGLTPNAGVVGTTTYGANLSGMQPLLFSSQGTGIPAGRAIKFSLAYSGAAAMAPGAFVKSGSASSEVMNTDYIAMEYLARQ